MVEFYTWNIYREIRETGCVFEDGSDTRKSKEEILLIPDEKEEEYGEYCAEEYGNQDYSYQFSSKKIARLDHDEIMELAYKWIMALEDHDVLRDKEKFGAIAKKIYNILKDHRDEDEKEN